MKTINFLSFAIFILSLSVSCKVGANNNEQETQVTKTDKIEVYYFHYTRRCATCNAVESVSREAIADLYGDKVSFADYNLDEKVGEDKGKELEISGQTLIIIAGDKKINLTNEGFMNARSNPEKLKQVIKEKIDGLM